MALTHSMDKTGKLTTAERDEQTGEKVKAYAARLNPMGHVAFVKHVATKQGFKEAKACIASALGQSPAAEPKKKRFWPF